MIRFVDRKEKHLITTVGSGLVDFLVFADDLILDDIGVRKGGMTLIDDIVLFKKILKKIPGKAVVIPGGAACNTSVGLAHLGVSARFVGTLGKDRLGSFFKDSLVEHGVEPVLLNSALPTGRVLSIITSDAQRTMITFLGASSKVYYQSITSECFEGSKIIHVEGYLLSDPKLIIWVLEKAMSTGALISLDLASFTIVEKNISFLNYLIKKYVDVLIGNEDEVKIYMNCTDGKKAVANMGKYVKIAVIKVGDKGSYISMGGDVIKILPFRIEDIVDSTGAGDFWAAGFLFGLVNDLSIKKCGEIASICGAEVCRVTGANIPIDGWERISKFVSQI